MYKMKSIIPIEQSIDLPTCMYYMKNPNQQVVANDDIQLNIRDQVMRFLKSAPNNKMLDLENRQDQLLKKLDKLYEKIQIISSSCKLNDTVNNKIKPCSKISQMKPEELVLVLSPDNLPWFLVKVLKENLDLNFTWHIHSSTPSNKIPKIKSFFEKVKFENTDGKVNLRLIFKYESASTELRISSLGLPILGNVNVLRYLCEIFPNTVSYDFNDYAAESLLDTCYLLENSSEKQKQVHCQKLFQNGSQWIYNNKFSIIDLAVYNEVKQWKNVPKIVPQQWLVNCEKCI
ncbi:unnamed protein product [Colias eurytheme]|nr:unnamed protein product [Colias eurytheme]